MINSLLNNTYLKSSRFFVTNSKMRTSLIIIICSMKMGTAQKFFICLVQNSYYNKMRLKQIILNIMQIRKKLLSKTSNLKWMISTVNIITIKNYQIICFQIIFLYNLWQEIQKILKNFIKIESSHFKSVQSFQNLQNYFILTESQVRCWIF